MPWDMAVFAALIRFGDGEMEEERVIVPTNVVDMHLKREI